MDWLYLFVCQSNFVQLVKKTVLEDIPAGFKGSNKIPDALVKFIEWSQGNLENQAFISGSFEFCEAGDWIMERFLDEPEFQKRFGVFGQSGDAYIYCVWLIAIVGNSLTNYDRHTQVSTA